MTEQVCYIAHTGLHGSKVKVFHKKEAAENYIIEHIRAEYAASKEESCDLHRSRIRSLDATINRFKEVNFVTGLSGDFHYIYETEIE